MRGCRNDVYSRYKLYTKDFVLLPQNPNEKITTKLTSKLSIKYRQSL